MMQSRRKMMELNLSDIENFTNLKRAFLVSIEEGRFGELPSTVQGRGMLNNYAKFLGMEESALMDLYGRALQLQRDERQKPQRRAAKPPVSVKVNLPEKWRKVLNPDLIIGGTLIIALFAFIIWGATQVFDSAAGEATEAPSISEMLQITATSLPTEAVETSEVEVEATEIPGVAVAQSTPTTVATVNAAPLQLYIITRDRAYMSVLVDGIETFSGRVSPENVYTYSGNESINLLTGNAYALEVYFNQEYLGNLGDVGEVVDIDFTLAGLITPIPRATLTPTPTLEVEDEDAMESMMEE
jgi:cytoskeletal protein RodZ